jgi:type IV pilus assembly protein PilV
MGAVAAQTVALRTRQQSALLSHGVQLASSLADRMRANAALMRAPDAANPYLRLRHAGAAPPPPAQPCHTGTPCDSLGLAGHDIHEFRRELHTAFPGSRAAVCRDAAPWDTARKRFAWECSGGAADPVVIKLGWRTGDPGADAEARPVLAIVVGADFT